MYPAKAARDLQESLLWGMADEFTAIPAKVDLATGNIIVMQNGLANISRGIQWYVKDVEEVSGNNTELDFLFVHDGTRSVAHAMWEMVSEHEFELEVYRGPTFSDPGTQVSIKNNRESIADNTGHYSMYQAPTITDPGTLRQRSRFGLAKKLVAGTDNGQGMIASLGAPYLFRFIKKVGGTGYLDFKWSWAEHDDNYNPVGDSSLPLMFPGNYNI